MNEENNLYGLAYDCPTEQRQDDCPLKHMEQIIFIEKVKWIDALNEEEKETILEHHQRCSKSR